MQQFICGAAVDGRLVDGRRLGIWRRAGGVDDALLAGGGASMLLTGVILSSVCMALVTLMLSTAPESRLRGMAFWMIGDLAGAPLFLYQLHQLHQLSRA